MPDSVAPTCIFCEVALDAQTRKAHVISRAIGGTLYSKTTECSKCNEDLGRLEDVLRAQMEPTAAALGALDGDGDPITAVVEVAGEGRVRVHAGRVERLADDFKYSIEGGKEIRWFRAPFDDHEHAKKVAAHLFEDGQTVESFDAGAVELLFDPPGPKRLIELPDARLVISDISLRVFGKFVLATLAKMDGSAARSGFLDEFRRYVHSGGVARFQPDPTCRGSGLVEDDAALSLAHGAEVWSSGGIMFGMVRLFGHARFSTRMGPWSRAPISVAYLFDPRRPRPPVVRHETKDGPAPVVFTGADGSELVARFVPAIERAILEAKALRGADPIPPTAERLSPMIRRYLEERCRRGRRRRTDRSGDDDP